MLSSYKELKVWQKSYQLVLDTYRMTERFPQREHYGLASQIRRCAISIVSNIAEGYQRQYTGEYIQYLSIAFGSCAELETQLMLAKDLSYLPPKDFSNLADMLNEIGKMLNVLKRKLKTKT